MKIVLYLLSAAAIFRFGEDSSIQPSHFIVPIATILMLVVAFLRRTKFILNMPQRIVISCVSYFFIRNIFEVIFWQHDYLIYNAFFWLNYAVILVVMSNVMRVEEWGFLVKCLLFNVFASAVVAAYQFATNFPIRAHGLSGTENHLAMQIVHVSLIYVIFYGKSNNVIDSLRVLGLATLSRAYMIHIFLVYLKKRVWVGFSAGLIIFAALGGGLHDFASLDQESESIEFLVNRLGLTENSSDQGGRGYLRVAHNPHYLIYGASEVVQKFDGDPFLGQIHSNFLSLFFCFGIPGLLFSILILRVFFLRAGFILGFSYFAYSLSLYYYSNAIFLIFTLFLFYDKSVRAGFIINAFSGREIYGVKK